MTQIASVVIVIVIIPVILLAGFFGLQAAFDSTATAVDVTNETHFPNNASSGFQAGEQFTVNESSVLNYSDAVTIYDENDTVQTAGTDYTWNESESNGTVTILAGGGLDGDANATISYTYYTHSDLERQTFTYWNSFAQWLPIIVFVLGAIFLLFVAAAVG